MSPGRTATISHMTLSVDRYFATGTKLVSHIARYSDIAIINTSIKLKYSLGAPKMKIELNSGLNSDADFEKVVVAKLAIRRSTAATELYRFKCLVMRFPSFSIPLTVFFKGAYKHLGRVIECVRQ